MRIWRWEISQISTLFRTCSSFRTLFWVCEDWSNFFVFTFFNLFSIILNWNTKLLLKGVNFLCSSWFYFYVFYFIGLINYNNKNFDVQVFCLIFLFQSFSKISPSTSLLEPTPYFCSSSSYRRCTWNFLESSNVKSTLDG